MELQLLYFKTLKILRYYHPTLTSPSWRDGNMITERSVISPISWIRTFCQFWPAMKLTITFILTSLSASIYENFIIFWKPNWFDNVRTQEAERGQIDINDSFQITALLALENCRVLWKMQNAHSMISVNVQEDNFWQISCRISHKK